MSAARDNARRNARGEFATTRADGTPVGSFAITYQDLCVEAFTADGKCIGAAVGGPCHEPGSHTRKNWFIRGPYTPTSLDSFLDQDWDDFESSAFATAPATT